MARRATSAKDAVKRLAKKLTARFRKDETDATAETGLSLSSSQAEPRPMARKRTPQTDIPIDLLQQSYTPSQTSLKAPFRASGDERLRDQEFTPRTADDRFNDEDRLTNKSGDPRIGTRGRTYEPNEGRRR